MSLASIGFQKLGLPPEVNFPLTLAPMVGLSHFAFRQLIREYLPEGAVTLWPSEMLNSRRIPDEKLNKIPESMRLENENFWMPQILANEENKISKSLPKLFEHGAQGIDINMGCPVQKALKHNYGVALMGDSDYAADVVAMTKKYGQGHPISVKLRASDPGKEEAWLEFTKKLEGAGANWLCLHPRTASQKRRGQADWSQIGELVKNVSIPVIGNGDIQTVEDVENMIQVSGCDMAMAGRVLTARPWLFWQLGHKLGWPNPPGKLGPPPLTPKEEGREYGSSLLRLIELFDNRMSERLSLKKFQFHVKTGAVWLPFGHQLYSLTTQCKNLQDAKKAVQSFFQTNHYMSQKTDLRQ